jgi:hypothetical protein
VSRLEDEDGIDGPFDRAMDRAIKADAKKPRRARKAKAPAAGTSLHYVLTSFGWWHEHAIAKSGMPSRRVFDADGNDLGCHDFRSAWALLRERGLHDEPMLSRPSEAVVEVATVRRRAAIDAAGKTFAAHRDALAKKLTGPAYAEAMRPHERDYDQCVSLAWDEFKAETEGR